MIINLFAYFYALLHFEKYLVKKKIAIKCRHDWLELFSSFTIMDYLLEHSVWSGWSAWTSCSATCGAGTHSRTRTCHGLYPCSGDSKESRACQDSVCSGTITFLSNLQVFCFQKLFSELCISIWNQSFLHDTSISIFNFLFANFVLVLL